MFASFGSTELFQKVLRYGVSAKVSDINAPTCLGILLQKAATGNNTSIMEKFCEKIQTQI